jgi:hypothetical protein
MRKEIRDALIAQSAGQKSEPVVFTWDRDGRGQTPRVYEAGRVCLIINRKTGQPYSAVVKSVNASGGINLSANFGSDAPSQFNPADFEIVDRFAETSQQQG